MNPIEIIGGSAGAAGGMGAGGMGLVGSLIGGGFSYAGGRASRRAAADQAGLQRLWEGQMMAVMHQTEMQDLVAAGLNPILTATGGSGNSWHSVPPPPTPDIMTPAVSSAAGAGRAVTDAAQTVALTKNVKADTAKKQGETHLNSQMENQSMSQVTRNVAETEKLRADKANVEIQGRILKEQLQQSQSATSAARTEKSIDDSTAGQVMRWINRFSRSIQGAGSSARSVRDAF